MVTATFSKDSENMYHISFKGHAQYVTEGKDIVCTAVSTYASVALKLLNEMHMEGIIGGLKYHNVPGDVEMEYFCWDDEPKNDNFLHFLTAGIEQIAEAYPDNVNLENRLA